MKKSMLALGLILILVCCGWQGYQGFGSAPAMADPEHPRARGYYQCDPYYSRCTYDNYYSAPYTDPLTQFFYYTIPGWSGGQIRREHPRRGWQREHPRPQPPRREHPR
jgi:hypothetical protein